MNPHPGRPTILFDPFPRSKDLIFRPGVWDRLQALGQVIAPENGRLSEEIFDRHLLEAVALIGQTDLPAERLSQARNLKAILNVEGNFLPNVDYDQCFKRGIYVLAAAPAFARAVAECALAMALDLARGITAARPGFQGQPGGIRIERQPGHLFAVRLPGRADRIRESGKKPAASAGPLQLPSPDSRPLAARKPDSRIPGRTMRTGRPAGSKPGHLHSGRRNLEKPGVHRSAGIGAGSNLAAPCCS